MATTELSAPSAYVYVIGAYGSPLKIGVARNLHKRFRSIQVGNPAPIEIRHVSPMPSRADAFMVEGMAHAALAQHRLTGEWFDVPLEAAVAAVNLAERQLLEGMIYPTREPDGGGGDGLLRLRQTHKLSERQFEAGWAYRELTEVATANPRVGPARRLAQVKGVIYGRTTATARALLNCIAVEGRTLGALMGTGSNQRRSALLELQVALDVVADCLDAYRG